MTLEQIREEMDAIDTEIRDMLAAQECDCNRLSALQGRYSSLLTVRNIKRRAQRNETLAHRRASKGEVA